MFEVWFASFHSVFKPVSFPGFFFCNEKGRLETGIILQFPVFDSLRYRPFVQCSPEIPADGVLAD